MEGLNKKGRVMGYLPGHERPDVDQGELDDVA
jgi:hypothetical protein